MNHFRVAESNRKTLLQYYDQFFALFRFANIIQTVFKEKPKRKMHEKKLDFSNEMDEFEYFSDEINLKETQNENDDDADEI